MKKAAKIAILFLLFLTFSTQSISAQSTITCYREAENDYFDLINNDDIIDDHCYLTSDLLAQSCNEFSSLDLEDALDDPDSTICAEQQRLLREQLEYTSVEVGLCTIPSSTFSYELCCVNTNEGYPSDGIDIPDSCQAEDIDPDPIVDPIDTGEYVCSSGETYDADEFQQHVAAYCDEDIVIGGDSCIAGWTFCENEALSIRTCCSPCDEEACDLDYDMDSDDNMSVIVDTICLSKGETYTLVDKKTGNSKGQLTPSLNDAIISIDVNEVHSPGTTYSYKVIDAENDTICEATWSPPGGDYPFDLCAQIPDKELQKDCCECQTGNRELDGDKCYKAPAGYTQGIWTAIGCIRAEPEKIVEAVLEVGISVAGGVALLMFLAASFMLSTSQGDPKKTSEARELITSAVIGILFAVFSVAILQFIGYDILRIPGFGG